MNGWMKGLMNEGINTCGWCFPTSVRSWWMSRLTRGLKMKKSYQKKTIMKIIISMQSLKQTITFTAPWQTPERQTPERQTPERQTAERQTPDETNSWK